MFVTFPCGEYQDVDELDNFILLIMPRSDHAYPVFDFGMLRLACACLNCRKFF